MWINEGSLAKLTKLLHLSGLMSNLSRKGVTSNIRTAVLFSKRNDTKRLNKPSRKLPKTAKIKSNPKLAWHLYHNNLSIVPSLPNNQ